MRFFFPALLGAWTTAALAAPPAPVVETSADIKLLNFDWENVSGASSYELWFRADNRAAWSRFSTALPANPHAYNNISAHLLNWDQARYQVKACNSSGCSASSELNVKSHMLESIGYFKGAASYANGRFGAAEAISENGQYLATIAAHEPGGAGDPAVVYVFTKANGGWQQQARIVPSPSTDTRKNRGLRADREARLALSADGSRLMVAMPYRNNTGSTGTRHYKSIGIYHRSGSTWTREYQDISPNYGDGTATLAAEMNEAADRVAYRWSTTIEVLERTSSGWVKRSPVPAVPPAGAESYSCYGAYELSGDGNTLVRQCERSLGGQTNFSSHLVVSEAPDWHVQYDIEYPVPQGHVPNKLAVDYSGNNFAVSIAVGEGFGEYEGQVQVFRITNGSVSSQVLRPGSWFDGPGSQGLVYGYGLAMSHDGAWLAVGDPEDRGEGTGVLSPPLTSGNELTGAVYVYDLRNSTASLRRVLKPNVAGRTFNSVTQIAFGNNGKTLVLADPADPSGAQGIDGNRNDTSKTSAGALWLY